MDEQCEPVSWQVISSKEDLKRFMKADLSNFGVTKLPLFYRLRKPILYYTVLLRKTEYLSNTKKGLISRLRAKLSSLCLKRLGAKLGFTISPNTFGPGVSLMHWGSIAISPETRIGPGARVHSCVNITGVKRIGKNVYLGPGAKLFGEITVGDNVSFGANTVVGVSIPDNATVLGNPGRVIKNKKAD